ncbi:MAG: ABC transporter permease [Octadecabacter sp.]|nr:ABC transporter permease [Octadecabacter sp.]
MFKTPVYRSTSRGFLNLLEVTYHSVVKSARSGHRNAVVAMILNMVQGLTMIFAFLIFFQILGLRSSPIRGDMLLYIMTGIFVYLLHIRTVSAVMGAAGPTSALMLHRPMNTLVAILSAALSALYLQVITLVVILSIYHIAFTPISIEDPIAAFGFLLSSWFTGVAVGMVFLALKPWFPRFVAAVKPLYIRINMIASGKLFLVNTLPATMIAMFDWNPLFHIIDQMRGAVFLHYNPQFTNPEYPIYVALTFIMIGLMGEFFGRRHVSLSWFAGR